MELNVFKRIGTTKDGRQFNTYSTRLTKNDGTTVNATLHFGKDVQIPAEFPCTLVLNKTSASFTSKTHTNGERTFINNHVYIKGYKEVKEFIDTSMDEFAD